MNDVDKLQQEIQKDNIARRHVLERTYDLLVIAHDMLDDYNASKFRSCQFCSYTDYDAEGLKHDSDCIIKQLRKILDSRSIS